LRREEVPRHDARVEGKKEEVSACVTAGLVSRDVVIPLSWRPV
jgi:hypothetical protein